MLDNVAALTFTGWSEPEARERIAQFLASGWSSRQLSLMFGVTAEEINRLAARPGKLEIECRCANSSKKGAGLMPKELPSDGCH
jgi:hypothetical protein